MLPEGTRVWPLEHRGIWVQFVDHMSRGGIESSITGPKVRPVFILHGEVCGVYDKITEELLGEIRLDDFQDMLNDVIDRYSQGD